MASRKEKKECACECECGQKEDWAPGDSDVYCQECWDCAVICWSTHPKQTCKEYQKK